MGSDQRVSDLLGQEVPQYPWFTDHSILPAPLPCPGIGHLGVSGGPEVAGA